MILSFSLAQSHTPAPIDLQIHTRDEISLIASKVAARIRYISRLRWAPQWHCCDERSLPRRVVGAKEGLGPASMLEHDLRGLQS